MLRHFGPVAAVVAAGVLVGACSTSTAGQGLFSSEAGSGGGVAPAPVTSGSAGSSPSKPTTASGGAAVAKQYILDVWVQHNAVAASRLARSDLRKVAQESASLEIEEIGKDPYRVGVPVPDTKPNYFVVPVTNVVFAQASYKAHVGTAQENGKWVITDYQKKDWDARAKAKPLAPNPPSTCTPGFVTTLKNFPHAALLKHYPAPNLKPETAGVKPAQVIRDFRSGFLFVYFTKNSTGLPHGPSPAMFNCYVKYVKTHGWKVTPRKQKKYSIDFFDSGSRFKGGNELTIAWTKSPATHDQYETPAGDQLVLIIQRSEFLPDLPPPPK